MAAQSASIYKKTLYLVSLILVYVSVFMGLYALLVNPSEGFTEALEWSVKHLIDPGFIDADYNALHGDAEKGIDPKNIPPSVHHRAHRVLNLRALTAVHILSRVLRGDVGDRRSEDREHEPLLIVLSDLSEHEGYFGGERFGRGLRPQSRWLNPLWRGERV